MGIAFTLAQYLLDRGIAYELVVRPRQGLQAGAPPADRTVTAVVVRDGDGFKVAALPASRRIAFDKLGRLLGQTVDLANEEQVEALFPDCEPNCVPALGAAYNLPVVVDDSLAGERDVYLESGNRDHLLRLSGASFQELMRDARHGSFGEACVAA